MVGESGEIEEVKFHLLPPGKYFEWSDHVFMKVAAGSELQKIIGDNKGVAINCETLKIVMISNDDLVYL